MAPELCNGLCSEIKFQFFLDALIALGTLLMAGVAIGAANTWRIQKRNELGREILEHLVRAHDIAGVTLKVMYDHIINNRTPNYFEDLYNRQKTQLDQIKTASDKAHLARIVLKDPALYEEMMQLQIKFASISQYLFFLSGPSGFKIPLLHDPSHIDIAQKAMDLHEELIKNKELINARESCIRHLERHIHYKL